MTLTRVTPGQPLTSVQKTGLDTVSVLGGGRDIVLAIDITESVGLNDEGHIRLSQIVQDSLKPGDSVYIVPFAQHVTLDDNASETNPLGKPLYFNSNNQQNIDKILNKIPKSDPHFYGTDIQQAELTIYQGIAQLNQNRLQENRPIKRQSIVWITDAPLFTQPGITSQVWVETPAESPFRNAQSPESKQRKAWIDVLPISRRTLQIETKSNQKYNLTVVDIAPTVQEFCTPAPGAQVTCLVNPYLMRKLWLHGLILFFILIGIILLAAKFHRLKKKWNLTVSFEATQKPEDQRCSLPNNKRIAIGEYDSTCHDSIDCPGREVRAYLERKGEKLYLVPNNDATTIYYNGKKVTSRTLIDRLSFRLNCPDIRNRDYEINIKVKK
ncbi:VWA domain-containing protein [Aetokthonos hydrillicola Thurmond2011]|uniref:VWA domain-containing protein n=1 Tax=Aetokthonos hydrillicola Thurmond2011 TaxID=2712845 RepID=A0AAP5IGR7_9CYAN|nr:VWA domain-containing protein [Aetokthonos hydrillicola]MBO3462091.1 VWA domain-containing protein [Aetokthonos hydrillicola CCALA 1050]MBW4585603.1 VWA domain-containing protein [Aetokthonos hydrillicola CCALA 1050]MDR9900847.1 VWA domain-containing protein [Aetokthonos hydrillicola Thurmond2011]